MTFRDNFQIHKKYENFYPTLELLHDQYYFRKYSLRKAPQSQRNKLT